jgi:DNA topoisomerase-2
VKSFIENPSFNSQTKEFMTTRPTAFGSRWEMPKKFATGLTKTGITEEVASFAQFKEKKELNKTDGKVKKRLIGIPKLDDANFAGTKKSKQTRLILTEGDSAKAFAMSGLSKIGRDNYGVFPLKGKLLNVKDQSSDKILKNAEITNLKQILGLKQGYKYKSLDETRYGGVIILTDQDVDGSHIKGLVMNMFHTFWPELLKLGFVKSLVTPIVKAFKGKESLSFYTLTDYENWKKENKKGWKTSINWN